MGSEDSRYQYPRPLAEAVWAVLLDDVASGRLSREELAEAIRRVLARRGEACEPEPRQPMLPGMEVAG